MPDTTPGRAAEVVEYFLDKPTNISEEEAEKTLQSFGGDILATITFLEKYALKDDNGSLLELTLSDAKKRWAYIVAEIEKKFLGPKPIEYFLELYDYFLPAGRQMAALGVEKKGLTLNNCYTATIEDDSLEAIFKTAYQIAKTFAYGGGQGIDLSPLRPRSKVANSAKWSTGAVSFGKLYSLITETIAQDSRRGALSLIIDVTHPSILEFINAKKKDKNAFRFCNLSVKATDKFMEAVENDKEVTLSFDTPHEKIRRSIKAQEIWDCIIDSATLSAEPGLLFWDTTKRLSPSDIYKGFEVVGTNPCFELPGDKDSACCLGSLLLDKFISAPYTQNAKFDWAVFREMVHRAVRHLDNIVELGLDKHPTPEQRAKALNGRRIGLGVTGIADAFAAMGIIYGSKESKEFLAEVLEAKRNHEYEASILLAGERGPFPAFISTSHYTRGFPATLPNWLIQLGMTMGQRNISISTIAPSGSVSIIAQTSSGIEPVFEREMIRIVELGGKRQRFKTTHAGVRKLKELGKSQEEIEYLYPTAYDIDPMDRVTLQSVAQQYIDSAISSTVNLPKGTTSRTVSKIYMEAWKQGLKGITVYVDGSREGILLPISDEQKKDRGTRVPDTVVYKFVAEGGDKFYVHVSYRDQKRRSPYQIFITNYKTTENDRFIKLANDLKKYLESTDQSDGFIRKLKQQVDRSDNSLEKITRLLSLALKNSRPLTELLQVLDPHCFAGTLATRIHAILSDSLEVPPSRPCPVCNEGEMRRASGGCFTCNKCGASTCD